MSASSSTPIPGSLPLPPPPLSSSQVQDPLKNITPPPPLEPTALFFDNDEPPKDFWARLKEDPLDPFWVADIKNKVTEWGKSVFVLCGEDPKKILLSLAACLCVAFYAYPAPFLKIGSLISYLKVPQLILAVVPYICFICVTHVASGGSPSDLAGLFDIIKMIPLRPPIPTA